MDDTLIRRVMPSSAETEQAVIGSILMDKDEMMNVADILVPDDFYQSEYRMIYQAMVQINSEGRPVDLVTVHEQLKSMNVPPEVSSLDFMIEVVNSVATSANAKHYAKIVKEKSLLRKVIKVNETIM